MWWRLKRFEFEKNKGKRNKEAMSNIVNSGEIPGILAYSDNKPIAWCSVAPREKYPSLERSRVLKRIDDTSVWSIVCFFIDKRYRNKGVSVKLLLSLNITHTTNPNPVGLRLWRRELSIVN